MAYDEDLAYRVRELVAGEGKITEKRMFGGLAFMLNGNLAVAVRGRGGLMVRVAPADFEHFQSERGAHATEMRGRPMHGWITVEPSACTRTADLRRWVARGLTYTRGLPPK